jgi:hypothetical protein
MNWLMSDPERDPRLGEALRRLDGVPSPLREQTLVQRIVTAARPTLGEFRNPPRPWWEQVADWSRVAMPAAVALGLMAAAILASEWGAISPSWSSGDVTVSETVLSAATLPAGEVTVEDQLLAPVSDEWLLSGAFASAAPSNQK